MKVIGNFIHSGKAFGVGQVLSSDDLAHLGSSVETLKASGCLEGELPALELAGAIEMIAEELSSEEEPPKKKSKGKK